jgi:transcriptional regulator with XRE-family HTH domain
MRVTPKPFLALLAERLKQLRESRGISVNDAAARLGVSRVFIWRIESGAQPIPTAMLPQMAELLDVDEGDICTFPLVATRHALYEATRNLSEEQLQELLNQARRFAKAAKSAAPPADTNLGAEHVRAKLHGTQSQEKGSRKKVV